MNEHIHQLTSWLTDGAGGVDIISHPICSQIKLARFAKLDENSLKEGEK